MPRKVYLRTYGCRANAYDTERVRAIVLASGAEIVENADDADVAVFNSCAVTAAAEADLRRDIRRAARARPELESIVMGCASALPSAASLRDLPGVSAVHAGADYAGVAHSLGIAETSPGASQDSARAVLRIQDGCDEHCTFCATRIARGAARSRDVADLVDEARRLAEHHPEIVLTGVHIGAYGIDTGTTLGELVETLVLGVANVRFRLSSIEATEVDGRLYDLFSEPSRVCPWLHAPLQLGSDRVLKRMGRHWYTASTYARAIERIVGGRPVFGLGADIITGFPGESPDDHAQTLRLVEELPFTSLHVFPYSERAGTAALALPDRVPSRVARERAAELRALADEKARAYQHSRIGQGADVVTIGAGQVREGLTEDYLSVLLPDPTLPRGVRFAARLRAHPGDAPHLLKAEYLQS